MYAMIKVVKDAILLPELYIILNMNALVEVMYADSSLVRCHLSSQHALQLDIQELKARDGSQLQHISV